MYKRIIVATDVSAASDAVVGCLSTLKDFGTKECLLLQCLSYSQAASASLAYDTEPLEEMLSEQKKTLEDQGFSVEARVVVGAPPALVTAQGGRRHCMKVTRCSLPAPASVLVMRAGWP